MTLRKVFGILDRFFLGWGLSTVDWILTAQYGLLVLGYKTSLRKNHLNVIVRRSKLPWQLNSPDEFDVHPPSRSKAEKTYKEFERSTGFEVDFVPLGNKRFKERLKYSRPVLISSRLKINVMNHRGNVMELDFILKHSNSRGWGLEKGRRIYSYVIEQYQEALKRKDSSTAATYKKLLEKYSIFGREEKAVGLNKDFSSLNGLPASVGVVRGPARVVSDGSASLSDFESGDVLITKMTSPKFTSLIKKAAAIVTDEGGRLCHAAIVSREMRIPCVVGTKIATKTFHNGDWIEVDGRRGVVRKVKK